MAEGAVGEGDGCRAVVDVEADPSVVEVVIGAQTRGVLGNGFSRLEMKAGVAFSMGEVVGNERA